MAKTVAKKNIKRTKASNVSPFSVYWGKTNYFLLLLGVVVIIAGYFFMSMGQWDSFPSLFVSPILLVIGYLIILPVAVLYKKKTEIIPVESKEPVTGKN